MKSNWERIVYWKLAITKVTGKAFIAVALSLAQGLNGLEWSSFTPTQKFIAIVLAVGTGWSIIDAFLDQTMSRLAAAEKAEEAKAADPSVAAAGAQPVP